jgi:hypothetical protein
MAAAVRVTSRMGRLNDPSAAKVPAAKRSESPGRKGVSTRPVSQNTMPARME